MSEQNSSIDEAAKTPLPPRSRNRHLLVVVIGLFIFGCGFVIGVGTTLFAGHRIKVHAMQHPEKMPANVTKKLERHLKLSSEQTKQVEKIVHQRLAIVLEIREKNLPRLKEEFNLMEEEIAAVLDERQQKKWKKHCDHFRKMMFHAGP